MDRISDVPPHNLEAEQAVLGSMLLDRDAIARVVELICAEDFYRDAHRRIYESVTDLFERGEPVDLITVTDQLRDKAQLDDVGGASYVTSLLESVPTAANVEHYARIVLRDARRRRASNVFQLAAVEVGRGDGAEALADVRRALADLEGSPASVVVRVDTIAAQSVRWLWPGRIPFGKVTVLDGDPGLGKSVVTLDIAARLSRGAGMPDGARVDLAGPQGVVLLTAEDDIADTVRPRLETAGADLERIAALVRLRDEQGERLPTLADLDSVGRAIRTVDAALVIIDPLMAYLPDERDAHRDHDIRRALAPVVALAARTGVAMIVVRHLNKSSAGLNPVYRGGGSIGIIGAARSGLLVAPDPDAPDSGRRILAVTKSNLSAPVPALAYRIEAPEGVAHVVWEGFTAHTAAALLALPELPAERTALDEATEFLTEILAQGAALSATEVKAAARQAGIAERTLDRARHRAGVVARREGFGPGATYVWVACTPSPKYAVLGEHGAYGEHDESRVNPGVSSGLARQVPHARQGVGVGKEGEDVAAQALTAPSLSVTPEDLARAGGRGQFVLRIGEGREWTPYVFDGASIGPGKMAWLMFVRTSSDAELHRAVSAMAADSALSSSAGVPEPGFDRLVAKAVELFGGEVVAVRDLLAGGEEVGS